RREIAGGFAVERDNRVGFRVGSYDARRPLVVDPTISYSLAVGGSGNDSVTGVAVGPTGNVYITGFTDSADFPTVSPLDGSLSGSQDTYVAQVKSDGTGLVWATYLGGSGDPEGSAVIAVDSTGNVYVHGATNANDFPVTAGAFQSTRPGGQDLFVTKLNAAGNALVYSTYLGGNSVEFAGRIAVDASNRAYVVGTTFSSNFPTHNAFDATGAAGVISDGFLTVLNAAGTALDYSTFLGGAAGDGCIAVAIDQTGMAYVTGAASSTDFPTTPGALSGTAGG